MWKNGIWMLYVVPVYMSACLLCGSLSLLSAFLLPVLCWLPRVYRVCGFSHSVAFTCVQPMNTMLKSMEKRRVRFGYIAPTPCLLMAVTGCVPSSNLLTSIGWPSPRGLALKQALSWHCSLSFSITSSNY